ncbi:MAG: family permease [Frankiales bacterium]|nr:family permease [Frankiales bacterium]
MTARRGSRSAELPGPDRRELEALREIGRHWPSANGGRPRQRATLPVDPTPPGGAAETPDTRLGRAALVARRIVSGAPLKSAAIAGERMRKLIALPVLSSDALSSVAYGPEAMLAVLVLAGSAELGLALPLAGGIAVLMLAVGLSYRQTIRAYPQGGGSYVVASDNLGRLPGLAAAAGLLTDYVMTVAVSIASGVAAIVSAVPAAGNLTVPIGLGAIGVLLLGNIRGVREAGMAFAGPTYAFILAIGSMVVVALVQAAGHGFTASPPEHVVAVEGAGTLLVLRAFASGATAMTGIETISNAVPAFERVEWRNARRTLDWMLVLLIALFAGTVLVVHLEGIVPRAGETVLSQLARRTFGGGLLYGYVQAATALVLLMAANAAFNGFPRLLYFMAQDGHAPRMFLRMGDRLAFNNGIVVLAVAAGLVFATFDGRTNALIPLYAVGVFLAFTLSQAGMVVHWWRRPGHRRRHGIAINGTGAVLSAVVLAITTVTKFSQGAWVVVLVIPLVVVTSLRVRREYRRADSALAPRPVQPPPVATREREECPEDVRHLIVVPVDDLDLAALRALAYAASLCQPVLALHVSPDDEEAARFHRAWEAWGDHLALEVVVSPYRAVVGPLVQYVDALHRESPGLMLTVVLPELVVRHWWHRILHHGLGPRLRRSLRHQPDTVVTTVAFHLPG